MNVSYLKKIGGLVYVRTCVVSGFLWLGWLDVCPPGMQTKNL